MIVLLWLYALTLIAAFNFVWRVVRLAAPWLAIARRGYITDPDGAIRVFFRQKQRIIDGIAVVLVVPLATAAITLAMVWLLSMIAMLTAG